MGGSGGSEAWEAWEAWVGGSETWIVVTLRPAEAWDGGKGLGSAWAGDGVTKAVTLGL